MEKKPEIVKKDIRELKLLLKELVKEIKRIKVKLKLNKRLPNEKLSNVQTNLRQAQNNYRNHQVAYCELRGIPRKTFETKTNNALWDYDPLIERIKNMYYIPRRYDIPNVWIDKLF